MFLMFYYYFYINLFGFALSGLDKLISVIQIVKFSRISEKSLLVLAALGAFPLQTVAFIVFNHKTRKRKLSINQEESPPYLVSH